MLIAGALFWVTSITMHRFIMKHPQIMNICDFGYFAFGKSKIAYEFTGFMLLANNILLIGFHVLTGAKVLNTLSDHSQCTVVFSVIATIMGVVFSIPRTLKHVSYMSIFSGKPVFPSMCREQCIDHRSCMHGYGDLPLHDFRRHRESTSLRLRR